MLGEFQAVVKRDEGLRVLCESRGFKLILDEPEDCGGTNEGMNPVEALLCALGACQAIIATIYAPKFRLDIEDIRIELDGDLAEEKDYNGYEKIYYTMYFKTKADRAKVEKFADFIEKNCPVGNTLGKGIELERRAVVIED